MEGAEDPLADEGRRSVVSEDRHRRRERVASVLDLSSGLMSHVDSTLLRLSLSSAPRDLHRLGKRSLTTTQPCAIIVATWMIKKGG